MPPMPGFVPSYQAALIVVYAVTTYLFFAQYRRTRSVPLLVLGAGSLYTTLIVIVQLLTFPNIFGTGRILGSGPGTTTWLWTLLAPRTTALRAALRDHGGGRPTAERRPPTAIMLVGVATTIGGRRRRSRR